MKPVICPDLPSPVRSLTGSVMDDNLAKPLELRYVGLRLNKWQLLPGARTAIPDRPLGAASSNQANLLEQAIDAKILAPTSRNNPATQRNVNWLATSAVSMTPELAKACG